MNKYDTYKDSGIEWIGDIPSHWEVKRLKHFSDIVLGKMLHSENLGEMELKPYLRAANLNWLKVDVSDVKEMWFTVNELQKLRLKKGDLLVSEGGEVGRTCIWENDLEECYIQNSVHKVTVHYNCNSKYYLFHFFSFGMRGVFDYLVNRISIAHLTVEKIREISFCIAPLQEQTAIANYLDRKTAEIDELIADKKRLLELYEEEKTAIINQAVTKGINPDAPMKDSGIEWLGEIPEHWEVKPIKYEIAKRIDNRGRTPEFGTEGIPMLEVKQLLEHSKYPKEQFEKYVQPEILKQYLREELHEGDILIATVGATAGKCCIVPANPYYFIAQNVIGFRFKERNNPNYFYYLIQSDFFKNSLYSINKSNTIDNLKVSVFIDNIIPVPDSTEQEAISSYIESKFQIIDIKVSKTQKLIELLSEYRTALISEVVTGKIKVVP
jgi:type I restriction enzyme S subunit